MLRSSRRRPPPGRGVNTIIGVVLLVAITVVAGAFLWSFRLNPPTASPQIAFTIRSGTSDPVWGDPTDCLPWFSAWLHYNVEIAHSLPNTTATYYSPGGHIYQINAQSPWGMWWFGTLPNQSSVLNGESGQDLYTSECEGSPPTGDFSSMNSTQFIVTSHTPSSISLDQVEMLFICNGTFFLQGTLSSMTWYPGSSTQPAPDAPHLGSCGTFVPSGSFSTLYNRFGIFVPITGSSSVIADGDTFIMYVHTSSPFDPSTTSNHGSSGNCGPGPDCDDFHGAPAWCFTTPGACTLYFYYTGSPSSLLFSVSLYSLIRG